MLIVLLTLPLAPMARKGGAVVVAAPRKRIHLALLELGESAPEPFRNRVADAITTFAGSRWFAYLHIAWFSITIASGSERYPYGLLAIECHSRPSSYRRS